MPVFKKVVLPILAFAVCTGAVSTHSQVSAHSKKLLRVGVKRDVDDTDADSDDADGSDADTSVAGPAPAPAGPPAPAPELKTEIVSQQAEQMHDMMEAAEDLLADHGVENAALKHQRELAGLMWIEEVLEEKLDAMNDEEYRKMIEKQEKPVAEETSPGLANMLGEMREDMHEYALPFYKKVLKEKIESLEKDQHQLVLVIADEAKAAKAKEEKDEEEEEEEPKKREKKEKKEKEEIEEPAPAPVEGKKRMSVGNNTIMVAAAAVVILGALAYILMQRGRSQ